MGGLVAFLRLLEVFAHFFQRFHEADEFVVEFAAFIGNLQGVAVLVFVPPDVGHGAQGGQQRAGADQDDALVETGLEELGVLLQGEQVGGLHGHEHEDEIERYQAFDVAVAFGGELFDVLVYGGEVGGELGFGGFPVCMAKTQYSLSDDPKKLGRPRDFELTVRDVNVSAGAGFVVVLTGDIMTLPGLPKRPAAVDIDLVDGKIVGLF